MRLRDEEKGKAVTRGFPKDTRHNHADGPKVEYRNPEKWRNPQHNA
jgi:hypothetical protein